jgi:hypothetical protein
MKKTLLISACICALLNSSYAFAEEAKVQNSAMGENAKSLRTEVEQNPSCANILEECKKLGFVSGGLIRGKGLWKSCFQARIEDRPIILSGKEVSLNVSAEDVAACKVVAQKGSAKK